MTGSNLRRRPRRRRDTEAPGRVLLIGAVSFLALAVFIVVGVRAGDGVPLRGYGKLYAEVPQIGNLGKHDPVRIAGVRVGQVMGRETGPSGARLELQLEPGTRIPTDSQIAVRGNGLLGARYVQIVVGSAKTDIPDGGTIKGGRTSYTYGVPETLDTFDAQTRGALGEMLREFQAGLVGRGDGLNDGLRVSARPMEGVPKLVASVLEREGAARRLLPALDGAAGALDAEAEALAGLFGPAADAIRPFAQRRTAVRSALGVAPEALSRANAGLVSGRRLVAATRALSDAARRTLPPAPAGLRATTRLLRDSHEPLQKADALLRAAKPAVPATLRLTNALSPVLKPADEALSTLTPIANRIGPHKCDVVNFSTVFRSVTGYGGTGEGPAGPAMGFRLQPVGPMPTEALGIADATGLIFRAGYDEPCAFPSKPYNIINPRRFGRRAGR